MLHGYDDPLRLEEEGELSEAKGPDGIPEGARDPRSGPRRHHRREPHAQLERALQGNRDVLRGRGLDGGDNRRDGLQQHRRIDRGDPTHLRRRDARGPSRRPLLQRPEFVGDQEGVLRAHRESLPRGPDGPLRHTREDRHTAPSPGTLPSSRARTPTSRRSRRPPGA